MSRKDRALPRELSDREKLVSVILHTQWDPIGCGVPADEYDDYAVAAVKLGDEVSDYHRLVAELSSFLTYSRTKTIGLDLNYDAREHTWDEAVQRRLLTARHDVDVAVKVAKFLKMTENVEDAPKPPEARILTGEGRLEDGPIQFADDWPGVFIRGDTAEAYRSTLERTLADVVETGQINMVRLAVLRGLISDLASADIRGDVTPTKFKSVEECKK